MSESNPIQTAAASTSAAPRLRSCVLIGLGIFVLALTLRLVHLMQLVETDFFDERPFVTDARYYDMRADEIAQGDYFGNAPAYLSPLYCQALGLAYKLPGFSLAISKLIQVFLGAISALLLYLIGRKLFGELAGAIAGLSAACYGLFIYYSGVLLPTTLILFLHLLLIWQFLGGPPGRARLLLVGATIGLTIGAKANAILLLPVFACWLLHHYRERTMGVRLGWIAAMALGAAVTISPITYGNWKTSGEFVLVTTTGGRNLLKGNGATANGTHVEIDLIRKTSKLGTYLSGKSHPQAAIREDRTLRKLAIDQMLANPVRTAGLWLRKFLLFFNHAELGIRDSYAFARTQTSLLGGPLLDFGLIIPIGLAGLLLLALRDRKTGLLALVIGTQVASFVIVFVLARYRVVAVAMLMLFAGALVTDILRSLSRRDFRRLSMALFSIALSIALVQLPIDGVPAEPATGEQLEYLGERAAHRGKYERAIEYYEEALAANFGSFEREAHWKVRERIGSCQKLLGRLDDARDTWTRLYFEISEQAPKTSHKQIRFLGIRIASLDDPELLTPP